ncbi:MAG: helix-turn-helix domain-containing protein [Acutalibacteraceae bacterium]
MKKFVIDKRGFYSGQLTVEIKYIFIDKKRMICSKAVSENYEIVYVCSGEFDFIVNGKIKELKAGDIFIAKPFENYEIIALTETIRSRLVFISFSPTAFTYIESPEFLHAFDDRSKGEKNVYSKELFGDFPVYESVVSVFLNYIEKNLPYHYFLNLTGFLIQQITLAYDEKYSEKPFALFDDYDVQIYDYIKSNAVTNITIDAVAKKFSVSKWYVDKVIRKFYGHSFRKSVKDMKMWSARKLIARKRYSLLEVSKLCGYSDYSAFYRAYTTYFSISPKDDLDYYIKNNDFYSAPNSRSEKSDEKPNA